MVTRVASTTIHTHCFTTPSTGAAACVAGTRRKKRKRSAIDNSPALITGRKTIFITPTIKKEEKEEDLIRPVSITCRYLQTLIAMKFA